MNKTRSIILDSLTKHSDYIKKQKNGIKSIGLGFDQHQPNKKFHYSEAYAIYGNGLLKLWDVTGSKKYLQAAKTCGNWLLKNRSKRYQEISWGLPWRWEKWDASADVSYSPNTAYGGKLLLELYKATQDERYLKAAHSVAAWYFEELGYKNYPEGICFNYSDIEKLRFPIYNQNSSAVSFLSRIAIIDKAEDLKQEAISAANFVGSQQNKDGSWHYSTKSPKIDNFHTGLVIEGLADCALNLKQTKLHSIIQKGYDFYKKNLFKNNGRGFEQPIKLRKQRNVPVAIVRYVKQITNPIPAYLWSYGSAMRAFSTASKLLKTNDFTLRIGYWVVKNLQNADGSFKFTENDDRVFVRHNAHAFDGLISLIK